ncbi:hypothetical protein [uncultured Pseudodesulfovibrio sp.]|uniref:hypothetical protein n=1 Tax=uncultured Pseudodesulfovibrio sp. TaxID=2035858 RepID=UPI0029C8DC31|nr:hypothetical protein [uncultured Pseudodesulfovibrio sp.]
MSKKNVWSVRGVDKSLVKEIKSYVVRHEISIGNVINEALIIYSDVYIKKKKILTNV